MVYLSIKIPVQILIFSVINPYIESLPVGTNTSGPEDEDAVVVEKVLELPEEGLVPTDSNVLGTAIKNGVYNHLNHLETNDFGEATFCKGIFQ